MKNLSENKYILKSTLEPSDIITHLKYRTLLQDKLSFMSTKKKDFVGQIGKNTFSVFYASLGGGACLLRGEVAPDSRVAVTATLNRAFRRMFWIGLIIIASIASYSWWIDGVSRDFGLVYVIGLPICMIAFRLFLHIKYVKARDLGMAKLRTILMAGD